MIRDCAALTSVGEANGANVWLSAGAGAGRTGLVDVAGTCSWLQTDRCATERVAAGTAAAGNLAFARCAESELNCVISLDTCGS